MELGVVVFTAQKSAASPQRDFGVVLWVKGVVAEVVSWKLGALRSNPSLFILAFLQPGEEKALGKLPVAKGGS